MGSKSANILKAMVWSRYGVRDEILINNYFGLIMNYHNLIRDERRLRNFIISFYYNFFSHINIERCNMTNRFNDIVDESVSLLINKKPNDFVLLLRELSLEFEQDEFYKFLTNEK